MVFDGAGIALLVMQSYTRPQLPCISCTSPSALYNIRTSDDYFVVCHQDQSEVARRISVTDLFCDGPTSIALVRLFINRTTYLIQCGSIICLVELDVLRCSDEKCTKLQNSLATKDV